MLEKVVTLKQEKNLKSLLKMFHHSQQEIERTDEYSIFTLQVRPTFDFQQEILSMGSDVEVLAPDWFRSDMAERVRLMWNNYFALADA